MRPSVYLDQAMTVSERARERARDRCPRCRRVKSGPCEHCIKARETEDRAALDAVAKRVLDRLLRRRANSTPETGEQAHGT
jgi:hypothetical protein